MIKAIIVDDEPLAQDVIETYIDQLPNIELVAKCFSAMEANEALKKNDVDLMFLDIQMPQVSGIEFVKSLKNAPKVIFTTAYSEFAVEGFSVDAVDYLIKPIPMDRFMKAINKVEQLLNLEQSEDPQDGFFFVKADKKLVKVNYEDILYVEGLKDYVIIKMEKGRIITLQTMKSLEKKLEPYEFKRIHRSYIANVQRIKAVVGNMIEMDVDGKTKQLPIGKSYRDELLEIINQNRL